MTRLTLTQAAAMTGVSRSTIHRATQSGKLSAHRDEGGAIQVDASELARVFPMTDHKPSQRQTMKDRDKAHDEGVEVLKAQVAALRDQLGQANDSLADLRDTVADQRSRLDWLQGQLAITNQMPPATQPPTQATPDAAPAAAQHLAPDAAPTLHHAAPRSLNALRQLAAMLRQPRR